MVLLMLYVNVKVIKHMRLSRTELMNAGTLISSNGLPQELGRAQSNLQKFGKGNWAWDLRYANKWP